MLRLMLVDDEPDILTLLENTLSQSFEIVTARNGLDALEKLERVDPDLIVMDVTMPCLNGFNTALSIRKNARYRNLPICFLTGCSDEESVQASEDLEAAFYLTKPFPPQDLHRLLVEYCSKRQILSRSHVYGVEEVSQLDGVELHPVSEPDKVDSDAETVFTSQETMGEEPQVPRILVIDDEPDVVFLIESFLRDDFEVLSSSRSVEAMEMIIAAEPDLILLDVEMPRMSGYQLSQLLKLNPALREIKIIFVTSRDDPQQIDYGYRLGAAGYVTKPFAPEDLQKAVRRLVDRPDFSVRPKKKKMGELHRQFPE